MNAWMKIQAEWGAGQIQCSSDMEIELLMRLMEIARTKRGDKVKPRLKAKNVQADVPGPREVMISGLWETGLDSEFDRDLELEREVYESNDWLEDHDDELDCLTIRDQAELLMWLTEQPID